MRIAFSTFGFTGEKYETAGRRLTLTNRPTLHQENLLVELPGFLTKVGQVVEQSPTAKAKVEQMTRNLTAMRPVVAASK